MSQSVIHKIVWDNYVCSFSTHTVCFANCYMMISKFNFELGYIISRKNDGKLSLPNLRPLCSSCHKKLGNKNMIQILSAVEMDKIYKQ